MRVRRNLQSIERLVARVRRSTGSIATKIVSDTWAALPIARNLHSIGRPVVRVRRNLRSIARLVARVIEFFDGDKRKGARDRWIGTADTRFGVGER